MEQFLGLPPIASEHGAAVDHLIVLLHWLMLILFIGWTSFFLYALVRFRKGSHPVANYLGTKSKIVIYLALAIAVFEVVLDVAYSVPVWDKRIEEFPAEKDATVVRVIAEQFAWNIHYPGPDGIFGKTSVDLIDSDNPLGLDRNDPAAKDDIMTINQMNIPVNKPVIVRLSSKDVIHSFNLPYMRLKQDAIPGMMIPLWFQPTKTTAEIQQTLAHKVQLKPFVEKTKSVSIPSEQTVSINGSAMDEFVLTQDAMDNTGTTILSAGDLLNDENVKRLTESQITSVKAREIALLDKFLSTQELKDKEGNAVLMKGEMMTEEAVTRAMKTGATQLSVRPSSKLDTYIAMEEYKDNSGNLILEKNGFVDDAIIDKLVEAGIYEIIIAPSTPTEIACAQLCGLGYYRMRGYMTIQTPEEFSAWLTEQLSSLQPVEEPIDSTSIMTDSTTISTETPQEKNQ
ncbi:MAG: hypothetical protein HYZ34_10250 [Ignavibacteriae bacterium]|nr:hypothetical protein [Ignavibacteriota bacterium]